MAVPDPFPEADEREPDTGAGYCCRSPDTAAGDTVVHVNPKNTEKNTLNSVRI